MRSRILSLTEEGILQVCNFAYRRTDTGGVGCDLKGKDIYCNREKCIFIRCLVVMESKDYQVVESFLTQQKGKEFITGEANKAFVVIPRKDRSPALGIFIKKLTDQGMETVIVNESSFAAYNKLMTYEEIRKVVDSMDETERIKINWGCKEKDDA